MGCWNETCAISNLPICCDDKIKCFIIFKNYCFEEDSFNYANDMYTPIAFPLSGKYNDYGCIEEIEEDWHSKLFVEHFNSLVKDGTIKIEEDSDEEQKDSYDIDEIVNMIERGRIRKKDNKREFQPVCLMMVLDEVYKYCISSIKHIDSFYLDGFNRKMTHTKTFHEKDRSVEDGMCSLFYDCCMEFAENELRWMERFNKKDYASENYDDFYKKIHEFRSFVLFLRYSRHHFMVTSGKGSQDGDYDFMTKLYKAAIKIAQDKKRKQEE